MQLTLLAQALLSAGSADTAGPIILASDTTGFDPDQVTASGNELANREIPKPWKSVFEGDYAVVGAGVVAMPRHEGASGTHPMPAAGAMGYVKGVGFTVAGPALTLDFVKGKPGAKVSVQLGPTFRYSGNRTKTANDPVIAQLPKLKSVIEGGVNAGITIRKVISKYDTLALGGQVRWDISGKGAGKTAAASASYMTPLSKGKAVGAQVAAEFADSKNANYNFAISAAASAASGLPEYRARGGFKALKLGAFAAQDLNNNFLDGGFSVGVGMQYSRLHGSAAKSPITALRGSRNQWMFGGGLAYIL